MADTVGCPRCGSVRVVTDAIVLRRPKLMSVTPAGQQTVLRDCPVCSLIKMLATLNADVQRNVTMLAEKMDEIRRHTIAVESAIVDEGWVEFTKWVEDVETAQAAAVEAVAEILKETSE